MKKYNPLSLPLFAKTGYYAVGNQITPSPGRAFQVATQTNQDVTWHFNEQAYGSINWRQPWRLPITEVYRMRAAQLREKYDYLILAFSGGADSTTILEAFIDNNIKLDEILVNWPISASEGKYTVSRDPVNTNFLSEWDLTLKPKLEWITKNHPEIKITVVDPLKDLPLREDSDDTFTISWAHNYVAIQQFRVMDKVIRARSDQYASMACITGIAPPKLEILDNKYLAACFRTSDMMMHSDATVDNKWSRVIEYFYWTPDMPEIVREQSHIVLDYLNVNKQAQKLFVNQSIARPNPLTWSQSLPPDAFALQEQRRRLFKSLIYPKWDKNTFQAMKPTDPYDRTEWWQWFWSNPESEIYLDSWRSAIASENRLIGDKFKSQGPNGVTMLKHFTSRYYVVGKLSTDIQ